MKDNKDKETGQKKRQKLFKAIKQSRDSLRSFRENRLELIKKYCGDMYGDNSNDGNGNVSKKKYLNLLNLTAEIYSMSMAAQNPQVQVETRYRQLTGFSKHYEQAINNQLNDMRFSATLKDIVTDAFFGIGVAKVFMASGGDIQEVDDIYLDPGMPFVEAISLDDFFFDSDAKKWSQIRFCGNCYRVPMEDLEDSMYDQEVAKFATASRQQMTTDDGEERVSSISNEYGTDEDEFEDMVDLIDVWLPREAKICTYLQGRPSLKPLKETEWDGPEGGPYHILTFIDVPDQVMGVPPAYNITHLDDLMNRLLRKFSFQSGRQKDITMVKAGFGKDGARVANAVDGEVVEVTEPENIQQVSYKGVDQATLAFSLTAQDIFNKASGNIDAMGGLGASAGTVGQEEMIQSAVSEREAKMQTRVLEFVEEICKVIGYMLWADEFRSVPGQMKLPGTEITIPADWEPGYREGDFIDYNFRITPHSMTYQSPSQKLASLNQVVQTTVIPMLEMIMQMGGSFDIQAYLSEVATLTNNQGIRDLVQFQNPPAIPEPEMRGFESGKPSQTTRVNIRKNVPTGGTESNRRHVQMQSLLDSGQNNNDQAQVAGAYQ